MNSNKSAKSRGIVALAVNTDTTDYVSIANQTLSLASHVLGLPYTLIEENNIPVTNNNYRHDRDINDFVQWRNFGRNLCFELSPYEETLVIDVDYVVQDSSLLKIFDLPWDYILMRDAHCLNGEYMPNTMGSLSLPYVWATVFAFRRTPRAKMFFDLVTRIQQNYHYYRELFNIENRTYRNDFAFAMADTILNGFRLSKTSIPGTLLNITQTIESITVDNNKLIIKDSDLAYVIPRMNMHVMSKKYLQSENFQRFVEHATA